MDIEVDRAGIMAANKFTIAGIPRTITFEVFLMSFLVLETYFTCCGTKSGTKNMNSTSGS